MSCTEGEIRDKLINTLHILDKTLVFLDKETYLPKNLGTRGFIDILAKDEKGHLVIIELKKADSTAREALHEVLKYLEGLKKQKKLNDDEIRIMIVSTHWKELIVPFSSFCKRCECNIEGYSLKLNDMFDPIHAERIKPLALKNDRLFCDHHMMRYYTSKINLDKGINSHISCFQAKGVMDYVLVVLSVPEGFRDSQVRAIENNLKQMYQEMGRDDSFQDDVIERIRSQFPDYKYIIYSAALLLTEEEYFSIIRADEYSLEEVNEVIDDYEGEDRLELLHDYAVDTVEPIAYNEYMEIGNAAKFRNFTEDMGWVITKVIRAGGLEDNVVLSDETIIEELRGSTGTTRQIYKKSFDSQNQAAFRQIRDEVKLCLVDNLQWQRQILHIIEQLQELSEKEIFTGKIYIFNPMCTIYSIYLMATRDEPLRWIPNYYIALEREKGTSLYFGCLKKNNKRPLLTSTIKKYYDDDPYKLFLSLTWGGYEHNDVKIADSLGLKYSTYLCNCDEEDRQFYEYIGYDFVECEPCDPFSFFIDFLNDESELVSDIIYLFEKRTKELGYTII